MHICSFACLKNVTIRLSETTVFRTSFFAQITETKLTCVGELSDSVFLTLKTRKLAFPSRFRKFFPFFDRLFPPISKFEGFCTIQRLQSYFLAENAMFFTLFLPQQLLGPFFDIPFALMHPNITIFPQLNASYFSLCYIYRFSHEKHRLIGLARFQYRVLFHFVSLLSLKHVISMLFLPI